MEKAVSRKEKALHCKRRTRGAAVTCAEVDALLSQMQERTNEAGVALFDWDDMSAIWTVRYLLILLRIAVKCLFSHVLYLCHCIVV